MRRRVEFPERCYGQCMLTRSVLLKNLKFSYITQLGLLNMDETDRTVRGSYDYEPLLGNIPSLSVLRDRSLATTKKTDPRWQYIYNNHHKRRGLFLIINNHTFNQNLNLPQRRGTKKDIENLREVFGDILGFEIVVYENLTISEMMDALIDAAYADHSDSDCFACAILTHGAENAVYGVDRSLPIKTILCQFNSAWCRGLCGKPKLFFFQSGRGSLFDYGAQLDGCTDDCDGTTFRNPSNELRDLSSTTQSRNHSLDTPRIPDISDFGLAYATPEGYHSFRNPVDGSWFIQGLCAVFRKYGLDRDFNWLMTRVNYYVAYNFETRSKQKKEWDGCMQVPSFESTLTKDLYFSPK